jgi:hypothetical protein
MTSFNFETDVYVILGIVVGFGDVVVVVVVVVVAVVVLIEFDDGRIRRIRRIRRRSNNVGIMGGPVVGEC